MKKLKHSKYKNTAVLFEMLVRQLTSDALNDVTESHAGKLIKKYFRKNSELSRELELYNSLKTEKFNSEHKSNQLLESVLQARKSLNNKILSKSKYNLVKELSESYDINSFFKSQLPGYPILASIYKMFEYSNNDNPSEYTKQRFVVTEHISTQTPQEKVAPKTLMEGVDSDTRELAYKILVRKFNEKYTNLNEKQKNLIGKYITEISNSTNLKTHINEECNTLKTSLSKLNTKVDNKVVKIKINETINILEEIVTKRKTAKDSDVLTLLNYYELESELQRITK